MIRLSIDPGENGAIVTWEGRGIVSIIDMPYEGKKLNLPHVYNIFTSFNPCEVIIEDVHSSPRSGPVSASNFMYNVGVLHMATIFSGADLIKIMPTTWKAATGLYGKPKSYSISKVRDLYAAEYQELVKPFKNKTDRAEAILIGEAYFKMKEASNAKKTS